MRLENDGPPCRPSRPPVIPRTSKRTNSQLDCRAFVRSLIDVNSLIKPPPTVAEPQPPVAGARSLQYDLFSSFLGSKPEDLSNTIELWDAFPKYAVSARMQAIQRDADGRLPV